MRIFGIRLRFAVVVALALAAYVAFQPQKLDPGKNQPVAPSTPPQAAPPPAPAQTQPTSPTAAQTAPQPGTQPGATPDQPAPTGVPPTSGQSGASSLPDGQPATSPTSGAQLPGGQTAAPSALGLPPSTAAPLTAAQRAAAARPPAPDSALPTTESPAESDNGRNGTAGTGAAASAEMKTPGDTMRTGPLTRSATPPPPTMLGGLATGIPIPPKPRYNRGQYLADTALSFRGLPYKWGGISPDTEMDCSGFIVAVCQKWHIDMPHSVI